VIAVIVLALFDVFEEGKDIIPTTRRMEIRDFFCFKE